MSEGKKLTINGKEIRVVTKFRAFEIYIDEKRIHVGREPIVVGGHDKIVGIDADVSSAFYDDYTFVKDEQKLEIIKEALREMHKYEKNFVVNFI